MVHGGQKVLRPLPGEQLVAVGLDVLQMLPGGGAVPAGQSAFGQLEPDAHPLGFPAGLKEKGLIGRLQFRSGAINDSISRASRSEWQMDAKACR